MKEQIQAIVTIMALVNPAMCLAIFSRCVYGLSERDKSREAVKAVLFIAVILIISSLFGAQIINIFGISLSAFACAGGGILVWIGADMLRSAGKEIESKDPSASANSVSITPLILFAASPGTIVGVITVAASHSNTNLPLTAITGVLVTLLILFLVLFASIRLKPENSKESMLKKIVTSYMGVIVIAMGVQFFLTGIQEFFG